MFSIRIVSTDHYLAAPVAGLDAGRSEFRGRDVKKVPVIRIYGSTPKGQKTCMHVHGIFPYIYVPHDATLGGEQPSDAFMQAMASSIDRALNMSTGNPTSGQQHVFKISAVSGTALYGFCHKETYFLKIYFYNPYIVYRAADLLLSGAVMHRSFQPHEAHVPYMLQFFIDYCLYGMNLITVSAAKFRIAKDQGLACGRTRSSGCSAEGIWNPSLLPPDLILDPETAAKASTCELEVDVMAGDILNRLEAQATSGTNPGLLALWADEENRRRSKGLSSQVALQPSQAREPYRLTDLENKWLDRFHEVVSQVTILPQDDQGSFVLRSQGRGSTPAESVNEESVKDVMCFTQMLEGAAHVLDQDNLAALLADMVSNDSTAHDASQATQSFSASRQAEISAPQPLLGSSRWQAEQATTAVGAHTAAGDGALLPTAAAQGPAEGSDTSGNRVVAQQWAESAACSNPAACSQTSLCSPDNLYRWSQEATSIDNHLESNDNLRLASVAAAVGVAAASADTVRLHSGAPLPSCGNAGGNGELTSSLHVYASCFNMHADDDELLAPKALDTSPDDDAREMMEMSQLIWDEDGDAWPTGPVGSEASVPVNEPGHQEDEACSSADARKAFTGPPIYQLDGAADDSDTSNSGAVRLKKRRRLGTTTYASVCTKEAATTFDSAPGAVVMRLSSGGSCDNDPSADRHAPQEPGSTVTGPLQPAVGSLLRPAQVNLVACSETGRSQNSDRPSKRLRLTLASHGSLPVKGRRALVASYLHPDPVATVAEPAPHLPSISCGGMQSLKLPTPAGSAAVTAAAAASAAADLGVEAPAVVLTVCSAGSLTHPAPAGMPADASKPRELRPRLTDSSSKTPKKAPKGSHRRRKLSSSQRKAAVVSAEGKGCRAITHASMHSPIVKRRLLSSGKGDPYAGWSFGNDVCVDPRLPLAECAVRGQLSAKSEVASYEVGSTDNRLLLTCHRGNNVRRSDRSKMDSKQSKQQPRRQQRPELVTGHKEASSAAPRLTMGKLHTSGQKMAKVAAAAASGGAAAASGGAAAAASGCSGSRILLSALLGPRAAADECNRLMVPHYVSSVDLSKIGRERVCIDRLNGVSPPNRTGREHDTAPAEARHTCIDSGAVGAAVERTASPTPSSKSQLSPSSLSPAAGCPSQCETVEQSIMEPALPPPQLLLPLGARSPRWADGAASARHADSDIAYFTFHIDDHVAAYSDVLSNMSLFSDSESAPGSPSLPRAQLGVSPSNSCRDLFSDSDDSHSLPSTSAVTTPGSRGHHLVQTSAVLDESMMDCGWDGNSSISDAAIASALPLPLCSGPTVAAGLALASTLASSANDCLSHRSACLVASPGHLQLGEAVASVRSLTGAGKGSTPVPASDGVQQHAGRCVSPDGIVIESYDDSSNEAIVIDSSLSPKSSSVCCQQQLDETIEEVISSCSTVHRLDSFDGSAIDECSRTSADGAADGLPTVGKAQSGSANCAAPVASGLASPECGQLCSPAHSRPPPQAATPRWPLAGVPFSSTPAKQLDGGAAREVDTSSSGGGAAPISLCLADVSDLVTSPLEVNDAASASSQATEFNPAAGVSSCDGIQDLVENEEEGDEVVQSAAAGPTVPDACPRGAFPVHGPALSAPPAAIRAIKPGGVAGRHLSWVPALRPPSYDAVADTCLDYALGRERPQHPYFGDRKDYQKAVKDNLVQACSARFESKLLSELVEYCCTVSPVQPRGQHSFGAGVGRTVTSASHAGRRTKRRLSWVPLSRPPTFGAVQQWLASSGIPGIAATIVDSCSRCPLVSSVGGPPLETKGGPDTLLRADGIAAVCSSGGAKQTAATGVSPEPTHGAALGAIAPVSPDVLSHQRRQCNDDDDGGDDDEASTRQGSLSDSYNSSTATLLLQRSLAGLSSLADDADVTFDPARRQSCLPASVLAYNDMPVSHSRSSKGSHDVVDSGRRQLLSPQSRCLTTPADRSSSSRIEAASPDNTYGFERSLYDGSTKDASEHVLQHLTTMSVEVHVNTRSTLSPNPLKDAVSAIFVHVHCDTDATGHDLSFAYCCTQQVPTMPAPPSHQAVAGAEQQQSPERVWACGGARAGGHPIGAAAAVSSVCMAVGGSIVEPGACDGAHQPACLAHGVGAAAYGLRNVSVVELASETDILLSFVDLVRKWDPDIMCGWDVQTRSLGYLLQRASCVNIDLQELLSRVPTKKASTAPDKDKTSPDAGSRFDSQLRIGGRVVLNVWRIMKHQVTLNMYSIENVVYHVLHERLPRFTDETLTAWYNLKGSHRWRVIEYYSTRARSLYRMMDEIDLIGQTSEFARIYGIEFYDVMSRGSQFKVESMMLRLAKPLSYVAVSPSVQQRVRMRAPECIQLTLEPESKFYADPVLVLDFQSLYPSIMIAYNYCYSTCLGRVESIAKADGDFFPFGCTSHRVPGHVLKKLEKDITVSPNGVVFVKKHVRKGILSQMVEEILNTRIMVKQSMKLYAGDKSLQRLLHARQLGLKLIANVTFGYTAANFSGRMPCVEIGDSILRKSRETLESAIKLVETTEKWHARVVYGDTDSMFILLAGRSKDEAFRVGQEIADAVTAANPSPVKLKFEKVYLPCILETKKRYVGYAYESASQKDPIFDAKGIETVRRDGCPAASKVLEKALKLLFDTRDVSLVKQYVQRQCAKVLEGRTSLLDFVFAKEYRGSKGYKPGACVPSLEIARRRLAIDPRAEPLVGERVPYVFVYGRPGAPLIELTREPSDVLASGGEQRINGTYYVTKQILPPLGRALSLLGVNVFAWYDELPRLSTVAHDRKERNACGADERTSAGTVLDKRRQPHRGTLSQYFVSSRCLVCGENGRAKLCQRCQTDPVVVAVVLGRRLQTIEMESQRRLSMCISCSGFTSVADLPCSSLDCPNMVKLRRTQQALAESTDLYDAMCGW